MVREWKEIGGLLLTDSGSSLLMRANAFSSDGSQVRSIDVLLRPDEMHELYTVIKSKLVDAMSEKLCVACKHYGYYGCKHPNREVRGYVCEQEQRKYFEPRYQL